ncbi:MAG: hypothetical protein ACK51L_02365, partial [bacterium]
MEAFIVEKVKYHWDCGAPLTSQQLQLLVKQQIINNNETNAMTQFISGKRDTLQKFISRTLQRNNWSV